MTLYISNEHPDCADWAVVNGDFELKACEKLEADAKRTAVAMALAENEPYGGKWTGSTMNQHDGNHNGMDGMA